MDVLIEKIIEYLVIFFQCVHFSMELQLMVIDCGREYRVIRTLMSIVKIAITGLTKQLLLFL